RLPSQFFEVPVDQDSVEPSGAWNLAVSHAAHKDVALPFGQPIARVEGDARRRNRGNPQDDRIAEPFLREWPLPWTAVGAPETDERPAIVGPGNENVYLVAPVRAHLDLPDRASAGCLAM